MDYDSSSLKNPNGLWSYKCPQQGNTLSLGVATCVDETFHHVMENLVSMRNCLCGTLVMEVHSK